MIETVLVSSLLVILIISVVTCGMVIRRPLIKIGRELNRARSSNAAQLESLKEISASAEVLSKRLDALVVWLESDRKERVARWEEIKSLSVIEAKAAATLTANGDALKALVTGLIKTSRASVSAVMELERGIKGYMQSAFGLNKTLEPEWSAEDEADIRNRMATGMNRREAEVDLRIAMADKEYDFKIERDN